MASGGAMTAGTDVLACQYTLEQLRTVVDEAHACGLAVTAHAHGLPAGIEVPQDLPGRLARNRIIVCPTLGRDLRGTPPPAVLAIQQRTGLTWQDRQALVGKLRQAGVLIASKDGSTPATTPTWPSSTATPSATSLPSPQSGPSTSAAA